MTIAKVTKPDEVETFKINLPDGNYDFRKLTITELERLQTLPEGYTRGINKSEAITCIGNGWTVDVIAHIFKNIPKSENVKEFKTLSIGGLFDSFGVSE